MCEKKVMVLGIVLDGKKYPQIYKRASKDPKKMEELANHLSKIFAPGEKPDKILERLENYLKE